MIRVVAILAFALAWARPAFAQLTSPGPLSSAHASIDGDGDCGKCHQAGQQVVAKLCLDCHKDLGTALGASRGLHGKQYKGQACETCHVEHLGRNTKLVRWPGGAMDKLDHKLTGYALTGGHAKPACRDCHKKTSALGKLQFLNTSSTCSSCHKDKDPHDGKFGADCAKCHGVADWKAFEKTAFDHSLAKYELTGKHATVACEKCHTGTPPKWKPLQFGTCEACHQDPHAGQFKPKACTACHDTGSWTSATDKMRTQHPKLSLANGHAVVKCEACHDRGNNKPPSKGATCASCHKPVHVAPFGRNCKECHASIRWVGLPESVGRANHDKTRYPLTGKHVATECSACHKKAVPQPKRYRGLVFDRCISCHGDPHAGEFAQRTGGECGQCHTVNGFAPTTFGLTAHATTAFALDGKHVATPCGACHTGAKPRTSFVIANKQCASCHENPHGTQFAKEMEQNGCATCHTAVDWHQSKIDHSIWPLVGAHATAPCTGCHGEQKRGASPAAYRGIARTCEGCHDDVHAGQFTQSKPVKDCKTCHQPTVFRIAAAFDHATTGFALDGKHAPVACANCHPQATLRDGSLSVRWRLGYRQCKDCHANPHREGQP